jgi:hypothetical protein
VGRPPSFYPIGMSSSGSWGEAEGKCACGDFFATCGLEVRGSLACAERVRGRCPRLVQYLQSAFNSGGNLLLSGHSLGVEQDLLADRL